MRHDRRVARPHDSLARHRHPPGTPQTLGEISGGRQVVANDHRRPHIPHAHQLDDALEPFGSAVTRPTNGAEEVERRARGGVRHEAATERIEVLDRRTEKARPPDAVSLYRDAFVVRDRRLRMLRILTRPCRRRPRDAHRNAARTSASKRSITRTHSSGFVSAKSNARWLTPTSWNDRISAIICSGVPASM